MDDMKIQQYLKLRQTMHYIGDPALSQYKALAIALRMLTDAMTVADAHSAIMQYHDRFASQVQAERDSGDKSLVDR